MSNSIFSSFITIIRQRSASYMHGTYMNNKDYQSLRKKNNIVVYWN